MRGLFIGRFQPLHNGHISIMRHSLDEMDELVVGIGSAENSYLPDDPFTAGERMEMLLSTAEELGWDGMIIPVPIRDVNRYSIWVAHVVSLCPRIDVVYSNNHLTIRLFREAGFEVRSTPLVDRTHLSGINIRARMSSGKEWKQLVPAPVAEIIQRIGGVERVAEILSTGEER